jgi:hypothetical protein
MAIVGRVSDMGFTQVPGNNTTVPYSKWTYVQVVSLVAGVNVLTNLVAAKDVPVGQAFLGNLNYFRPIDAYAIDKTLDSDAEPLPMGVGVKLVNDWGAASGGTIQASDGYVSIGVIMFDKNGQLTSQEFSISAYGFIGATNQMNQLPGTPNNYPIWTANNTAPSSETSPTYAMAPGVQSQFGLVLFQRDAYQSQGFTNADPTYTSTSNTSYSTGSPSEKQADTWLDQNATPLLINRYNGTLVKGE